jgi:tRNA threonylcarbamoyl adenosine modification protein YeaZ/ribosomal-protein-alanine acetyltransferase
MVEPVLATERAEYNIPSMVLLALETATRAGSLAIRTDRGLVASHTGDDARTHGVRLPSEIIDTLHAADLSVADVDRYVVVIGPGSFTGLRVGLATIQGLALSRNKPTVGIPTFDAMAAGWIARLRADSDEPSAPGALLTCLDGARGDLFYAVWGVTGASGRRQAEPILAASAGAPAEVVNAVLDATAGMTIAVTGSVTASQRRALGSSLEAARFDPMPNLAAAAADLAFLLGEAGGPPHALRPQYVRRSDAELARERLADSRGVTISLASGQEELEAVSRLQAGAFERAWDVNELRAELAGPAQARVYVARAHGGAVIGYCACWCIVDELHVNSMAVDPRWRRRGVGRALLRRVLEAEGKAGARTATLEVRESNLAGRALYEGLGFRIEGVRRGYYENPREDALILWRRGSKVP